MNEKIITQEERDLWRFEAADECGTPSEEDERILRLLKSLETAEAGVSRLTAERDWLAKVCAMHCRDKCTDDSQCNISDCAPVHCRHACADQWKEAARKAVAVEGK